MHLETLKDCSQIEIVEINEIGVADEQEDMSAIYPCKVKWRPVHATPSLRTNFNEGIVNVLSLLKSSITKGIYSKTPENLFTRAVI